MTYEEVFQKQSIIDKELFYQLEAQYRSVIEEIEGELDILFEKNRFRYQ
jgi:hypothetical protein